MFESVKSTLQDPLMQQVIWSGIVVILVLLFLFAVRKILQSIRMDDERRILIRRWFRVAALSIGAFFLFRIWALGMIQDLLEPAVFQKIVVSLVGLLVFGLIITIVRRLIAFQTTDAERRRLFSSWSTCAFLFLYAFLLFRTWTQSDLSEFFQNAILDKLFRSAFALGIVYIILFFVRRFINAMKVEISKRHGYRKRAAYIAALVYIIILIPIWAGSSQQWTTILSVMGAGIALALHDVLLNIAGWFYIVIRRPYKDGDRIELGGVRGDVIDIRLFETTLLEIGNWVDGDQSTGRVVHLPHGQIFRHPLHNYTRGFEYLWNEVSIILTFESNWQKAREILLQCGEEASREVQDDAKRKINRMAREYLIYYRRFGSIVYTKIEDSGVKLTLRYLTGAKQRRGGEDTISMKILAAINSASDIEFAYPTYRIYRRGEEE